MGVLNATHVVIVNIGIALFLDTSWIYIVVYLLDWFWFNDPSIPQGSQRVTVTAVLSPQYVIKIEKL